MEAKAKAKYLRIGARKTRLVLDLVRAKEVSEAFDVLGNLNKKAARLTEQLLKSAVANAKTLEMDESTLFISDIRADEGPTMKRFMARSMGRADRILKPTTHLSVTLVERPQEKDHEKPAAAAEEKKPPKKKSPSAAAKKTKQKTKKKTATK